MLKSNTGEELNTGADTTPDARLDIVALEFLERQRSAFFLCENLPPKYRLVLSDERLGAKVRVTENQHTHKLKDLKIL